MEHARLSDPARLPTLGPEILDVVFELGCATASQLRFLLARRPALRTTQLALKTLREADGPLADGLWRSVPFAAPEDAPSRARTQHVHYLTGEGVDWVAASRDLHRSTARSLYSKVLQDATVGHALLRNEFYARLCRELSATSIGLDRICAEAGVDPIELGRSTKGYRRYLNPDGLMEFYDDDDETFYRRVLVESDTGNQTHAWQIAGKANHYAEYLLRFLRNGETYDDLPSVLFVSPNEARSLWVRETLRRTALEEGTAFNEARTRFREQGVPLPDLFSVTNLEWVGERGALGEAYWSLGGEEPATLFRRRA